MPKYSVMLEGENFPFILNGDESRLFGFVTTRRVRANNVKDAEKIVLDMINNDKTLLKSIDKTVDVESKVSVIDIVELKWWNRLGGNGYSFYPMDETQPLWTESP